MASSGIDDIKLWKAGISILLRLLMDSSQGKAGLLSSKVRVLCRLLYFSGASGKRSITYLPLATDIIGT